MGKLWVTELLFPDVRQRLQVRSILYRGRSSFQKIEICDTSRYGKVLLLDDVVQTTGKDEFIYHEMMVHPAMFSHPRPRKVLVIGGGDGGILREALKHPLEKIFLVEIDRKVIACCKRFLPEINCGGFRDPRTEVVVDDGARFLRATREKFDVVIIDSSDPIGPAETLFTIGFYRDLSRVLTSAGIMVRQCGSSFLQPEELPKNIRMAKKIFPAVRPFLAAVPTYIGGFFSLLMATRRKKFKKMIDRELKKKYNRLNLKTRYYHPGMHSAVFCLPGYMGGKGR